MAKKVKETTIEEKLQNALVPPFEQPYKLPENWCWTRLEVVCSTQITDGTHQTPKYSDKENGIPFISSKDVTTGKINWENIKYITKDLHEVLYKRVAPQIDDILLAKNGTTGIAALVEENLIFDIYVTLALLRPNKSCILPRFLYHTVNSPISKEQFNTHLTGIGVPNLHLRDIRATLIPLPPLAEQKRIVDRIESLFAKLDEAKELAQSALDSFENRKSAILHKAFTGELTKKWREENGVSFDSWEEKTLQQVCTDKITDGTHQTPKYSDKENGVPFISSKDVTSGKIDWTKIKFITKELHEVLYKRVAPKIDDVLLAKNGTTGVAAIVEDDLVFDIYVTLALLRPNKEIVTPRYLYNIVNSPICKEQFNSHLTGIGVPNLHLRDIREVLIPLPQIKEQQEIVCILDSIFAKETEAKELASVIEKIDLIKKSILSKAFRGELGTNDANEESSVGLLKEILEGE